jgi:large subunit ribosomal protein L17
MLKNLVSSLFLVKPNEENGTLERVITTREKAKEGRRLAEKVITLGKRGTLPARRRALQLLGNKRAVRKVFEEIAPRYTQRPGGYTRILGLPVNRLGDNARQVIFELVESTAPSPARPVRPVVAEDAAPAGAKEELEAGPEVQSEPEEADDEPPQPQDQDAEDEEGSTG